VFAPESAPTNETWRLVLAVMAGLLASVLVLTPSPERKRR
jgi:hypothetical protein